MANHAYVYDTKKEIVKDVISELVKQFNQEIMHGFMKLEEEGDDGYWCLYHEETNRLPFWITDDFEQLDDGEPSRAIEFRHSHRGSFMWWVDMALENWLAEKLGGMIVDESDLENVSSPDFESFSTFEKYEKNHVKRIGLGWFSWVGRELLSDKLYADFQEHISKTGVIDCD